MRNRHVHTIRRLGQLPFMVAAAALSLLFTSPVAACVCDHNIDPCEALETAEKVALVKVIDSYEDAAQVHHARLLVLEAFKATTVGETIVISHPMTTCHPSFSPGEQVVAFIDRWQGELQMATCSGTSSPEYAIDFLSFLREGGRAGKHGRLSVSLEHWENDAHDGPSLLEPVSGAEVVIRRNGFERSIKTNARGLAVVSNLDPGAYTIVPHVPQGMEVHDWEPYGASWLDDPVKADFVVNIVPEKCAGGTFRLNSSSRVIGIIRDEEARPAVNFCVFLEPAEGEAHYWFHASACTDSDGRFSIGGVAPGDYILRAGNVEDEDPPELWFPGSKEKYLATKFTVEFGRQTDLGEFRFPMAE